MSIHARVLGVAQDAGVPHIGCTCANCERYRAEPLLPTCLGIIGRRSAYLIDATPAIAQQIYMLGVTPRKILLTHTHMGHIAGLVQLGEEGLNCKDVEVFGTPEVCHLLEKNDPWARLVKNGNIRLVYENAGTKLDFEDDLQIESFPVNHRGLETVGYFIRGSEHTLLYLTDIDAWDIDLPAMLQECDLALLDGSFYSAGELPRQADVHHPTIEETLNMLDPADAAKVRFTHLNHTNPALDPDGPSVLVAVQGDTYLLSR